MMQKRCDSHAQWRPSYVANKFIICDIPHEVMQDLCVSDIKGPVRILPQDGKVILFGNVDIFLRGMLSDMKHNLCVVMTRKRKLQIKRTSAAIKSAPDRYVHGCAHLQSANM